MPNSPSLPHRTSCHSPSCSRPCRQLSPPQLQSPVLSFPKCSSPAEVQQGGGWGGGCVWARGPRGRRGEQGW
eukprot:751626-Hanusia_phi.AAC.5